MSDAPKRRSLGYHLGKTFLLNTHGIIFYFRFKPKNILKKHENRETIPTAGNAHAKQRSNQTPFNRQNPNTTSSTHPTRTP